MRFNLHNVRFMQYLAASIATLTISSVSSYTAWPSPVLPKLQDVEQSPFGRKVTDEEGSWIASIPQLATPPSCLFAAWLINRAGRKGSLMLASVLLLVPWIITMFAKTPLLLCLARFLGGLGFGCVYTATAMYTGEISDVDIRGKLGIITGIMKLLGTFVILAVGPFVSFASISLLCAMMPVLFLALMCFMPESPYHLLLKQRKEDARAALVFLSPKCDTNEFIDKRLLQIEETIENDMQNKGSLWEFLSNVEYRQSLYISIGVKSLNQLCGVIAIDSYMQTIVQATGSSVSPEISSIIFGAVQIPAALLATFLVDKVGRKPLLVISSVGCALAMGGEGIYFYLQNETDHDLSAIAWLPTTGIVVFLIMSNIGITTIPTVLLSEIFPTNVKGIAIAVNTFYGSSLSFMVSKFFMPVSNAIGMHYSFFIFTAFCIAGIFFVAWMPETKGKSFAEIQTKLNRKYVRRKKKTQSVNDLISTSEISNVPC